MRVVEDKTSFGCWRVDTCCYKNEKHICVHNGCVIVAICGVVGASDEEESYANAHLIADAKNKGIKEAAENLSIAKHTQIVKRMLFEHSLILETEQELHHDSFKKMQTKVEKKLSQIANEVYSYLRSLPEEQIVTRSIILDLVKQGVKDE